MRVKLSDDTYEYIKQQVVDMFQEYEIQCVPISAFEISSKLNIPLIPYSALSADKREASMKISSDGYSRTDENGILWVIYYNDSSDIQYGRKNNTIMHEIGHYYLGHLGNDEDIEEAEAKFFAKYALAPPPLVHQFVPESPVNIQDHFDITFEAACYALNYYKKWLSANEDYLEYEVKLLSLFKIESA